MKQSFLIVVASSALCLAALGEPVFTHSDDPHATIEAIYKSPPDSFFSAIKQQVSPKDGDDGHSLQPLMRFVQQHGLLWKVSVLKPVKGDDILFLGKRADLDKLEKLFVKIGAKY